MKHLVTEIKRLAQNEELLKAIFARVSTKHLNLVYDVVDAEMWKRGEKKEIPWEEESDFYIGDREDEEEGYANFPCYPDEN